MGDGKTGTFIFMLIQAVVFLAPVLIVFYKQGQKDQRMSELEKDVNGIGKKIAEVRDTQTGALTELTHKVESVEKSIIELATSMKFLAEAIKELKK
jgi:chaperonin cofactor prefoldin